MPLSWNEIKNRALTFTQEWQGEISEKDESQSFWNDFFNVFGISRRRVATFEESVKKLGNKQGFIDLFWKGVILIEHKSKGKNLEKAYQQAIDYFPNLQEHELPKYILFSDFDRFRLYDLDHNKKYEFLLTEFVNNVHLFDFIAGYKKREYKEGDPVNIQAAELMRELCDRLKKIGYNGHELEVYLVRLLFCLFADNTGIFNKGIFQEYIDLHTKEDGSDLAMHLGYIFHVLKTPSEKRLTNLDENLAQFPYVNGKLFEENLSPAFFDSEMRQMLLKASALDWGKISPAIFGSMFQAVMNPQERRNLGAHYTSEKNIQKVIKPLFLDDLYEEFYKLKDNQNKLREFHQKLANLKFLDPACGCGNFLIISYRELRDLEILVLKELQNQGQLELDINYIIQVDIDQFYGIEYDEFAVRVAEVAMWLIDHQMNMKVSNEFGQYFVRLPLKKSANIIHGNALQIDWNEIFLSQRRKDAKELQGNNCFSDEGVFLSQRCKGAKGFFGDVSEINFKDAKDFKGSLFSFNFIFGNPPFIGKSYQNSQQKSDMNFVFNGVKNAGVLDYVCAWYLKASQFIQNTKIKVAFVSTNSISQGEQVGILWQELSNKYKIKIHFAHRTFYWSNEAKNNAIVHCIIIGFAHFDIPEKRLFDYLDIKGEAIEIKSQNISPYLTVGKDLFILSKSSPLCNVPKIKRGNSPYDGGNLLLDETEKDNLLKLEPQAEKFIKNFIGAKEFISGKNKYCIWLVNANPSDIKKCPFILEKIEKVRKFRTNAQGVETRKYSAFPSLFRDKNNPDTFIVIPRVSSENRKYIPMGFFDENSIPGDTCMIIPNGDLFLFGILTSEIHTTWVKYVCGRLKSDYRYSKDIVYNNYPFPEKITDKQREKVETFAQKILDIRAKYPDNSLADLYDPLTMPLDLMKAHLQLDKAVDLCYRSQPFSSELNRIEFLFNLYENLNNPLLKPEKNTSRQKF